MGRKDSPSNAGTSGEIRFGPQEEETHQSITTQVTIFNYSSILYLPQSWNEEWNFSNHLEFFSTIGK